MRARVRVRGIVQGVGFRPYVYRLARSLDLTGHVLNDARGVLLEVEGEAEAVSRFLERLPAEAPPLAAVESVESERRGPVGGSSFRILASADAGRPSALVSPDTATCEACLAELRDPADRRWRYPFINCTNCGPRLTIVRGIPYDRPLTTMAGFEMCAACRAEYEDPADRRFHAQPVACPACGPRVELVDGGGRAAGPRGCRDTVEAAARALLEGAIVALKGLGGFHLACRADDGEAVARLRGRKHREDKPFALMPPDLEAARALVRLGPAEERLLNGRARPILLARRRQAAAVADAVAPGHRDLGVVLPYSPLHHLLLGDAGRTLVMTSGNVSDEPIAYRDAEALERLGGIADLFLLHDRPIETRTDDSVLRVVRIGGADHPLMLRRSRGYVPAPLPLPLPASPPLLACGAHLKNTFTVADGGRAWVGHHIGDLENYETLRSFREGVEHFERLFEVDPGRIVHDLHPEYLSTKYAAERAAAGRDGGSAGVEGGRPGAESGSRPGGAGVTGHGGADARTAGSAARLETVGVQHHHAHLAACLAEHGERGPALGAIFDGTGWGPDGTVWGGEFLAGDLGGYERVAHLWPARLPGGEAAVREPWRMACAWLLEAGAAEDPDGAAEPGRAGEAEKGRVGAADEGRAGEVEKGRADGGTRSEDGLRPGASSSGTIPPIPPILSGRVDPERWEMVARLAVSGFRSPATSSVGRLFDAVAALCGLRTRVTYEGQAAIELEMAASGARASSASEAEGIGAAYPLPLLERIGAPALLDARPAVRAVLRDVSAGVPIPIVAARFHDALAETTAHACRRLAGGAGLDTVVLSGGVFQNALLLEGMADRLSAAGLRVLVPRRIPPNDGGISYGQAAVAAARG